MSSLRSKVIVAVATPFVLLIVAAVVFPIFAQPSSKPSITGLALLLRANMAMRYRERPARIVAWTSRSGPPSWMDEAARRSIGRRGWNYFTRELQAEEAELSIAPNAVGRRWDDLSEEEPVLVATFQKKPSFEVAKSNRSPLIRPRIEHKVARHRDGAGA